MARTKVFVSYSHDDRDWLARFLLHIAVLQRRDLVDVWSDARMVAGAEWEEEIENSLSAARVAVLRLVSPAFLASEYIWSHEMPRIVAHSKDGMAILPLIVRPCAWRLAEELARLNARPTDGRPLSLGNEAQVDSDLEAFAYELAALVGRSPVAASQSTIGGLIEGVSSLVGIWSGYYNRTKPLLLTVEDVGGGKISGKMEYSEEGSITKVEGTVHPNWSPDDQVWAQIGAKPYEGQGVALSFRETQYEKKGSSLISFNGEYRAFARGKEMMGAWFSGQRLVGSFALHRVERLPLGPERHKGVANTDGRDATQDQEI
jgi:hypothetical protein